MNTIKIENNNIRQKILLFVFLTFFCLNIQAQSYCGTPESSVNQFLSSQIKTMTSTQDEYHLRVYFHVIRNSNGIGGPTEAQVLESFNVLNDNYNPHDIFFHVVLDCDETFFDAIDYIDNDTHVPTIFPNTMFNINNHQDGIDIYLGGENSFIQFSNGPGAGGIADGVGEDSALIVAGTWTGHPPVFYTATSNIIAHEMGHVLFLWHTHRGSPRDCFIWPSQACAEFVDGSNCNDCGDEVCDTPADPHLFFNVSNNCVWDPSIPSNLPSSCIMPVDPNGDVYTPNTELIMAYTNPHCMSEITEGQEERVKCSIETLPFLQNCLLENINISMDTNWDTNMDVFETVTVENGVELEITAQIRFAEDAKLIIERGAKVTLDGGVLTSLCGNVWPGVELRGDDQLPQSPTSNQGWLNMKNNAEINNAEIGVWVGGSTQESNGGILTAYNSTFRNNERDVYFSPYQNYNNGNPVYNKSKFYKCDFIVDDIVGAGGSLTNRCRVQLNWVDGIYFMGCTFGFEGIALNNYDYSERGSGILSSEGGFRVQNHCSGPIYSNGTCLGTETQTVFKNLDYGIFAAGSDPLKIFSVKDAQFNNNRKGIHAVNSENLSIIRNTFDITANNPVYNNSYVTYGIHLADCNGYEIEENEFFSTDVSLIPFGVVITDSDDDPNRVYYNEFHDLFVGTMTQGDNQVSTNFREGLQILCGQYENNTYDIACTNSSKIAFYQGNPSGSVDERYSPANQFLTNVFDCPGNRMIYLSSSSDEFNYYYKVGEHPFDNTATFSCWNQAITPYTLWDGLSEMVWQGRDQECLSGLTYGGNTSGSKKDKVIEKRTIIESTNSSVNQLEDGGNTTSLVATIQNPNNSSYAVRNNLIDKCPYLSDEVLIELINRNPEMGQWDLTELLINNSPLTYPVLSVYYETQPLQPLYHSFLMNYQDGESTLNSIKSELKRHRSIKKDAQSDYIRMMTIDMEEIPDLAEIKDLLLQDETNEAIKLKYSIALQEEDFTTAQNLLNQYVSTTDDDAWVEFQELAQEIKAIGNIEEITSDQITTLESFIANNKRERHVAKVLLWLATGEEYVEDIEIPDDSNNKSFIGTGKGKKEIALVDLPELTVFPNPASDEVFFTFELPEDMRNTFIKIYSAEGKMVYNEDITGSKGMYRVDISKLSEGNYLTEILVDNIQVMNAKFIKN